MSDRFGYNMITILLGIFEYMIAGVLFRLALYGLI